MATAFDAVVKQFLLRHKVHWSEKYLLLHQNQLKLFHDWLTEENIPFDCLKRKHVDEYIALRRDDGKSEQTLAHDVKCLRRLIHWCYLEDLCATDWLATYPVPKVGVPFVRVPNAEELHGLLNAARDRWNVKRNPRCVNIPDHHRRFHARLDAAILSALIDSAARIGEILALRLDDVRPSEEGRHIEFRETKSKTPRYPPISEEALDAINDWKKSRPRIKDVDPDEQDRLFVNQYGRAISPNDFGKRFRRIRDYLIQTTLPQSAWAREKRAFYTLHGVRHYALSCLAEQGNIPVMMRITGHARYEHAERYNHLNDAQARSLHAAAAPLGRVLAAGGDKDKPRRSRKSVIPK